MTYPRVTGPRQRYSAVPVDVRDPAYLQPVLDAEARRGNGGRLDFGTVHDTRAGFVFDHPADLAALEAEFELGERMAFAEDRPGLIYQNARGGEVWRAAGYRDPAGPEQERSRRQWWDEWSRAPRPRVRLRNPFVEGAPEPRGPRTIWHEPPASIEIAEGPMSTELPGLGLGWSVWHISTDRGPGLLVVAPNTMDAAELHRLLGRAGATDLPVLVVRRGLEPDAVHRALLNAGASMVL